MPIPEPEIELVIARHEEDLAWIHNSAPGIRVTIYNKGGRAIPDAIQLPNEGREAQTYLHHLVTRYGNLAPFTVFCQGHPFDHCSNFHAVLRELKTLNPPLHHSLGEGGKLGTFRWLGFIIDWDDAKGQRLFRNWSKNEHQESLDLELFCREVLQQDGSEPFVFFPGAQFIVSRELILSRPKRFYEKALKHSQTFPHAAHCFERTWDRVFGINGIPEKYWNKPLPIYLKPIKRLS